MLLSTASAYSFKPALFQTYLVYNISPEPPCQWLHSSRLCLVPLLSCPAVVLNVSYSAAVQPFCSTAPLMLFSMAKKPSNHKSNPKYLSGDHMRTKVKLQYGIDCVECIHALLPAETTSSSQTLYIIVSMLFV